MRSTTDDHTEEGRAFLQSRVSLLGAVMSVIAGLATLLQVAISSATELMAPWFGFFVLYTAMMVATWLGCRRGIHSTRLLRGIDAVVLLGSSVAIALMGWLKQSVIVDKSLAVPVGMNDPAYDNYLGLVQNHMSTSLIFAIALAAVLRAALVPSRPLRTAVLTTLAGVPVLVAMSGIIPVESMAEVRAHSHSRFVFMSVVNAAAWLVFTTMVATAISRVIYGLRREIRDARQLGQYTLERRIGAGGMGEVWRARHAMMRRPTAVKLLSPDRAGEVDLARFEREVQLTAQLSHPHTITIYDYGRTPDGIFYYAMELLDGATVQEIVELDGPQPAGRIVKIMQEVASALDEAHGIGLIHRDVKPANIILCHQGGRHDVAKLVDFGLVKEIRGTAELAVSSANAITGTPLYLAPESLTAPDKMDGRGDLYSLGAVGYFLATGEHVFSGNTLVEVCGHHLHTPPTPPSERLGAPIDSDLEAIILSCLAKDPAARPQSAAALQADLCACRSAKSWDAAASLGWWQAHGDSLRARRTRAPGGTERTLAVDLSHHAHG